jgi:hypothetical protein
VQKELPLWTFAEIAASESGRAALLESAPASSTIQGSVIARFEAALIGGHVHIGMEQSGSNQEDLRAVLQFPVGETLFDQFFNANAGYRALFRRDWRTGLSYNRDIVAILRSRVASSLAADVLVRHLTPRFEDCGAFTVSREQICRSLDPDLSKVWFCDLLIASDGQVVQLPTGATGPRLRLDEQTTWAALARNDQDAWLSVKGAFVGSEGPYQPKDPADRAKKIQASGEA